MPYLADLVVPGAVILPLRAQSRRQAIEAMAAALAPAAGIDAPIIEEYVLAREALGPTGLGEGVALPHARVPGLARVMFAPAVLESPVDFGGPDGRPSDILVMLLSPPEAAGDHLRNLARLARLLDDARTRAAIRASRSAEMLLSHFGYRLTQAA